MAAVWGDGTNASSDGQYFRAGGRAGLAGDVNARHGVDPGVVLYTHHSGPYAPMFSRVISATAGEAPYVVDGLHPNAHRTSIRIAEHYTDTAGAADSVFGLRHALGYFFAPRIRDLRERRLYSIEKPNRHPPIEPLLGDPIDTAAIVHGWAELVRVKTSIEAGAVAPSAILRRLAAAGAGNTLARALRAVGRIERTLFVLRRLSDPALRQRSHAGLNKGEAGNALRRAVFFHRQGEFRDRTFENQFPRPRPQPRHRRHRPLEHHLPRPRREAAARRRPDSARRAAGPRRTARVGTHLARWRLRLGGRITADRRLPATPRWSRRVPGLRRSACILARAVQ